MKNYLSLLRDIYCSGVSKGVRTGTGTLSSFGDQLVFDLDHGFPVLTTKTVYFKHVVTELLWFLRGDTNIKFLHEHDCHIWDAWADQDGNLGPVYGSQWRSWGRLRQYRPIDQISDLVSGLQKDPDSRRHIVSAWNVGDIERMKLPPCHCLFQCYVRNDELDLHLYQRSADLFIGVPFNIASYALLLRMLAQVTGLRAKRLLITFGDVHIYQNHIKQVEEQLDREPRDLPVLVLNPHVKDIFAFTHDDIRLEHYNPHPPIRAKVAV
jgi:thymidylate synthase